MSDFQILNSERYPLRMKMGGESDQLSPTWRFEHRATLARGTREFIVIVDNRDGLVYVEEITTGNFERIEDDELHMALANFAAEKGFCKVMPPILKPAQERFI